MTRVRPDLIHMTSLFESFKNYQTSSAQIVVSGVVTPAGRDYSATIPYTRTGSIADIYVSKQGSNSKRPTNSSYELNEFVDANLQGNIYVLYSPGFITVNISIVNFDVVNHTPATQTFDIEAVIFDAPIAN